MRFVSDDTRQALKGPATSLAPLRVAVDAYSLDLPYQTGIGVYCRNLVRAYRAAGLSVAGLFGRPVSSAKDRLLMEVGFHRPGFVAMTRIDRLRSRFDAMTGMTRAFEIERSGIVRLDPLRDPTQDLDSVLNFPRVFSRAARHFSLTGRFLPVRLPKEIQLMHWTMPLPLRARGIPNIYTILDVIPFALPSATLGNPIREMKLIKGILASADRIVTISEFSRHDIARVFDFDAGKIVNLYLAAQSDREAVADTDDAIGRYVERSEGLPFRKYFVYVGSIDPRKNVDRLVDAYLKADTTFPLVICSSGGWMNAQTLERLDHIARMLGAIRKSEREAKQIVRVDKASDAHIARLIRGARALVFPSIYEGFGLPILEAMQLRTPVITSQMTSTAEIAGDAALLVDPFSIAEIADALDRIWKDDELCLRLAQAGIERAGHFSLEAFGKRIGALVRSMFPA